MRCWGACPASPLLAASAAEAGGAHCQNRQQQGLSPRFPRPFCINLVSPLCAASDLGGLQEPVSEVRSLSCPVSPKTSVSTSTQLSYCCSEIKQHCAMQTDAREFKTGMGLPGEAWAGWRAGTGLKIGGVGTTASRAWQACESCRNGVGFPLMTQQALACKIHHFQSPFKPPQSDSTAAVLALFHPLCKKLTIISCWSNSFNFSVVPFDLQCRLTETEIMSVGYSKARSK